MIPPVYSSGTATTSLNCDICWITRSTGSFPAPTSAPGCTSRSVTTPSNGAVIRRYACNCFCASTAASAARLACCRERTCACAASTCFSAWINSLPAIAPGVSAAFFNFSDVLCAAASCASACNRSASAACTLNSASAIRDAISGALSSAKSCPLSTLLPRSTRTRSTNPGTLACNDTLRNGKNSPGKSAIRDACLVTTATRSFVCAQPSTAPAVNSKQSPSLFFVIVSTLRIHRIERCRGHRCPALQDHINGRQDGQRGECRYYQPANHRAPERLRRRYALSNPDGHRHHPENHGRGSHQNCPQPAGGALPSRVHQRFPFPSVSFRERYQQNRIRHCDSDSHDRAHERLNVDTCRSQPQHQQDPAQHRRNGQDDRQRQPDRLEVRRQQQKDHHNRQQQTVLQPGDRLRQHRNLPTKRYRHSARWTSR